MSIDNHYPVDTGYRPIFFWPPSSPIRRLKRDTYVIAINRRETCICKQRERERKRGFRSFAQRRVFIWKAEIIFTRLSPYRAVYRILFRNHGLYCSVKLACQIVFRRARIPAPCFSLSLVLFFFIFPPPPPLSFFHPDATVPSTARHFPRIATPVTRRSSKKLKRFAIHPRNIIWSEEFDVNSRVVPRGKSLSISRVRNFARR